MKSAARLDCLARRRGSIETGNDAWRFKDHEAAWPKYRRPPKLRRLYKEESLAAKRRRGRKQAPGTGRPLDTPMRPNERWTLAFALDVFGEVRRFRTLGVIKDAMRECLGRVAYTSPSGARVERERNAIIRLNGKPRTIVSDNGTERNSRAILEWRNDRASAGIASRPASQRKRLHRGVQRPIAALSPNRKR